MPLLWSLTISKRNSQLLPQREVNLPPLAGTSQIDNNFNQTSEIIIVTLHLLPLVLRETYHPTMEITVFEYMARHTIPQVLLMEKKDAMASYTSLKVIKQ